MRANADAQRPTRGLCREDRRLEKLSHWDRGTLPGFDAKASGHVPAGSILSFIAEPLSRLGVAAGSDRGLWGADTRVLEHASSTSSPHSGLSSRISNLVVVAGSDTLFPIWK